MSRILTNKTGWFVGVKRGTHSAPWLVELLWRRRLNEERRKRSDVTSTLQPADFLRNVWKYCKCFKQFIFCTNESLLHSFLDFTLLCSAISQRSFLSSCSAAVREDNYDSQGAFHQESVQSQRSTFCWLCHNVQPETFSTLDQFVLLEI